MRARLVDADRARAAGTSAIATILGVVESVDALAVAEKESSRTFGAGCALPAHTMTYVAECAAFAAIERVGVEIDALAVAHVRLRAGAWRPSDGFVRKTRAGLNARHRGARRAGLSYTSSARAGAS